MCTAVHDPCIKCPHIVDRRLCECDTTVSILLTNISYCFSFDWLINRAYRKPEAQTKQRDVSEKNIRAWFANVKEYFDSIGMSWIFNDPQRLLNCDEKNQIRKKREREDLKKQKLEKIKNKVKERQLKKLK